MNAVPKLYVEADPAAPMVNEWVTWKLGVSTLVISQRAPSKTWFVRKVSIYEPKVRSVHSIAKILLRAQNFLLPPNFVSRSKVVLFFLFLHIGVLMH